MSTGLLTLNDVHRILRDRIGAGVYTVGSRLPSCRALAAELGTNPSTVDRALHRLAGDGLVRTSPRQGSVVTAAPESTDLSAERFDRDLRGLVMRAQAAGLHAGQIQRMVADALVSLNPAPRVAFLECNQRDLDRMSRLVERASGVTVEPVLLSDAAGRRLDAEYDAIATPIFHLRDLEPLVDSFDAVIEVNATPAPSLLRRLATLPSRLRVVVAAPTSRGLDRMAALVGQYTPTPPERLLLGTGDLSLLDGAVLVRNNASNLPPEAVSLAAEILTIEWELDNDFARTFPARVNAVVNRPTP